VSDVTVRRTQTDDVDFLLELVNDADVEPFMGARSARTREALLEEIQLSERDPQAYGRFVIEADGEPAGTLDFVRANERSRIARVGGFAVDPRFRGRGIGVEAARAFARHHQLELDVHPRELEI
jgi:RimJ/RimL family protein N-acetyltransferase